MAGTKTHKKGQEIGQNGNLQYTTTRPHRVQETLLKRSSILKKWVGLNGVDQKTPKDEGRRM